MAGIGTAVALILGVGAAVLFVIAIAVFWGYLGTGDLYSGLTGQNYAVYGVLAAIGAIGAGEWENASRRR